MLYEAEKKSNALAIGLAIFVPSAGHAYAGNWGTGLLFAAGRIGALVLTAAGVVETAFKTISTTQKTTNLDAKYYVGLALYGIFTILEAFDASAKVDKYNKELYDKMMGKNSLGLNIVPSKNGLELQLSYSF